MADSSTETLAKNLAVFMREQKMPQAELAKLSGLGQTTVSLYLHPDRRQHTASGKEPSPSLAKVQALADALGKELWELLRPLTPAQRDLIKSVEAVVAEHMPPEPAKRFVIKRGGPRELVVPKASPAITKKRDDTQ